MPRVGQRRVTSSNRAALIVLAIALTGCERGCLLRWFTEQQGDVKPTPEARGQSIDLGGIDCADGLMRCTAGVVEASRVGHLPATCGQRAKGEKRATECICPWDAVRHCTSGCADEQQTILATDLDAGASQMCKPLSPFARPILPEDHVSIDVCADDGITCRDAIVSKCVAPASPSQPMAKCIFGCAIGLSLADDEDGPTTNPDGLVSILCQHSAAERP